MRHEYRIALAVGGVGSAGIIAYGATGLQFGAPVLLTAAAAPLAVLCAVWGRMQRPFPLRALLLGLVIGPVVALLTQPAIAGFMYAFVAGFAASGHQLIDALRLDPQLTTALGSPWVLVLLVGLVAVAPLTEELGKALVGVAARPRTRQDAFLFGVASGVGFAVIEDLVYAGASTAAGGLWSVVALSRVAGVAVHPLATGLVMLGWWEWRRTHRVTDLVRGYAAGLCVHAIWNGTVVVVGVVVATLATGQTLGANLPVSFTFGAVFGVVMIMALWRLTVAVSEERPVVPVNFGTARAAAAVTILGAALLIPIAVLVITFPDFYRPTASLQAAPTTGNVIWADTHGPGWTVDCHLGRCERGVAQLAPRR